MFCYTVTYYDDIACEALTEKDFLSPQTMVKPQINWLNGMVKNMLLQLAYLN